MPHVSVCLAVFNGEKTLAEALTTVKNQIFTDYEILVVDDGSTDSSAKIATDFGCRVITQENQGLGACRKKLVEEAKGELIAFLDHDDFWTEDKLQKQVQIQEQTQAVLVHSDCWFHYDDGSVLERNLKLKPDAHDLDHILPTNWVIASSALFHRESMLSAGNFVAETIRCSDWYGWLILAPVGKFHHQNEKLVRYSVRSESLANAGFRFHEAQRFLLKDLILNRFDSLYPELTPKEKEKYKQMIRRNIGIACSSMAKYALKTGDVELARSLSAESLKTAGSVPRVWTRAAKTFFSSYTKG